MMVRISNRSLFEALRRIPDVLGYQPTASDVARELAEDEAYVCNRLDEITDRLSSTGIPSPLHRIQNRASSDRFELIATSSDVEQEWL